MAKIRKNKTGEPLPDDLLDAMVRAKNISSGLATLKIPAASPAPVAITTRGVCITLSPPALATDTRQ